MARWAAHPAWLLLQETFCTEVTEVIDTVIGEVSSVPASSIGFIIRERRRQINIQQLGRQIAGCLSTMAAWLGGKQDDRPLHALVRDAEEVDHIPVPEHIYDYHFVPHWLHENLARCVLASLVGRVNPEHPEILWKKYGAKFADDVQSKRVLYGLQAVA